MKRLSSCFNSAMRYTCFSEIVPLALCPALTLPNCTPAAFFMKYDTGGDVIDHSKVLSLNAVKATGMGTSACGDGGG